MAAAWIIEWNMHRRNSPKVDLRPHILPWRWRASRVFDYMRCVYWNSPLWFPFESLERVNMGDAFGFRQGGQADFLTYGDVPHLVGCRVKDLKVELTKDSNCVMEWTMPPRCHFDSKTSSVVRDTAPFKRHYIYNGSVASQRN